MREQAKVFTWIAVGEGDLTRGQLLQVVFFVEMRVVATDVQMHLLLRKQGQEGANDVEVLFVGIEETSSLEVTIVAAADVNSQSQAVV